MHGMPCTDPSAHNAPAFFNERQMHDPANPMPLRLPPGQHHLEQHHLRLGPSHCQPITPAPEQPLLSPPKPCCQWPHSQRSSVQRQQSCMRMPLAQPRRHCTSHPLQQPGPSPPPPLLPATNEPLLPCCRNPHCRCCHPGSATDAMSCTAYVQGVCCLESWA